MTAELIGDLLIYTLPWLTAGLTFTFTIGGIFLSSRYQHNKLVQALLILDQVVIDVVKELNQTVVEELKNAKKDGKLTKDEADQIKSQAINLVMKRLNRDMFVIIQRTLGPVVDIIATKIEAAVLDNKKTQKVNNPVKVTQFKGLNNRQPQILN